MFWLMCGGEVGRCTNTRPILVGSNFNGGEGDVVYSRSGSAAVV